MRRLLAQLWRDQGAVTSVEYSLLLALVAVAALVSFKDLGCGVSEAVWRVALRLQFATHQ